MARARTLKPGFFDNEVLAECHPLARILFAGLWCYADREGRLEDRPKRLKKEILGYDDTDILVLLDQLYDRHLIIRYTMDGVDYIFIPTFLEHQKPHVNEVASDIPAPATDSYRPKTLQSTTKAIPTIPLSLIPITVSLSPEDKSSGNPIKSKDGQFEEFWKSWPIARRKEKPNALKAWREAIRKSPTEDILKGFRAYLETKEVKDGFEPYPAKWLKQERWLEDLEQSELTESPRLTIEDLGDTPENRSFLTVLDNLNGILGDAKFKSWCKDLRLQHKNCSVLTLEVPIKFTADWIAKNLMEQLQIAVNRVWPEITDINIQSKS